MAKPAEIPAGQRVYAVGDIHGRADLLVRLLDQIYTDRLNGRELDAEIVFLGDYIDRGPGSRSVLERLGNGPDIPRTRFTYLAGNHEAMLLAFLTGQPGGENWLKNGAHAVLENYNVPTDKPIGVIRATLRNNLPHVHRTFLHGLKLSRRIGDYLFVHAGIKPGTPVERQLPEDMLWIREQFLESEHDHGFVVVHGHTARLLPEDRGNRIGIDTGAWSTGRLTALVLEGRSKRYLMATDDGAAQL